MGEIYPYRANDELTAAWREMMAARDRHIDEVVKPFTDEHQNNAPMVDDWERVIGFADGAPHEPAPAGLSRSQKRTYLIPMRGRQGDVWRERMERLKLPRSKDSLFRDFGLREQLYTGSDGRTFLGRPNAVDFGEDGVFVYMGCEIEPVPPCLTAVKLSEFYAAQERAQDRAGAGA